MKRTISWSLRLVFLLVTALPLCAIAENSIVPANTYTVGPPEYNAPVITQPATTVSTPPVEYTVSVLGPIGVVFVILALAGVVFLVTEAISNTPLSSAERFGKL